MENNCKISVRAVRIAPPHGITVEFAVGDELKQYFKTNIFQIDYSVDILDVPYGLAVIPFVCNVLPIVWLTDATLYLDELDEDFYNCVEKLKQGYREIYPNLQFKGKIECKKIRYEREECNQRSLVFFSGGVDAFATLIAHIDECPTLFSICGADVKLANKTGWNTVMTQIKEVSDNFNLSAIQCYSNFREFIDEEKLCELVTDLGAKDDYWHGFQHGIGLIGHAAPLAYSYGYTKNYIASSYTIRERGICTCASDPRIDNNMRFCDSKVCHDQFEYNRQEKIQHIVEYCRKNNVNVKLRVCWITDSGNNCCTCEKCIRTIYGILAEKENPMSYGFYDVNLLKLKCLLKYKIRIADILLPLWGDIINRLNEQEKGSTQIEWLRKYSTERISNNYIRRMSYRCIRILKILK